MTGKEYGIYLRNLELAFAGKVDSGQMSEDTYYKLSDKLEQWASQYLKLLGMEDK